MSVLKVVIAKAPVTTFAALSGVGFLASSLLADQVAALVLFYVLAVPFYVLVLISTAIAIELGAPSGALLVAIALVGLGDLSLLATRRLTHRALPTL